MEKRLLRAKYNNFLKGESIKIILVDIFGEYYE